MGHGGGGGGAHSKINYMKLNETPDARIRQFFKKSTEHAQSH